jgi:hypothetical protein
MNRQSIYDLGYVAGQLLYAKCPDLDKVGLINQAAEVERKEAARVPLTMFSNYRDGVVAGYEDAKKESEVKE